MSWKRIAAMVVSVVALSGGSIVDAAEIPTTGGDTTVVEGNYRPTIIRVTVPATGAVYINPFELPVWINSDGYVRDQIVSTPSVILNESEIPMSVDVAIAGFIGENSDMILSGTSTKDSTSTQKEVFLYFEMKAVNFSDPDAVVWEKVYDPQKHVIVRTAETTKEKVIVLDEWDEDGQKNCYGAFRLTGDCVSYPESEWNSNDGLSIKVSFSFTPVAPNLSK